MRIIFGVLVFEINFFFFLGILVENNRFRFVYNVVIVFGKFMSVVRGEVLCLIIIVKVCKKYYYYYFIIVLFCNIRYSIVCILKIRD